MTMTDAPRQPIPCQIDWSEVSRFLKGLLGTDTVTWQTFDDNEAKKDDRLAGWLHGTPAHVAARIELKQRLGAGAFFMVNEGDGHGRAAKNVKRVPCYFADGDEAPLENAWRLGLEPTAIVETSDGRFSWFYRVTGAPLDRDHFKRTQIELAELFDSDPSVCDLSRVMRLPGTWHQKGKPFQCRLHHLNPAVEYTEQEFQAKLAEARRKQANAKNFLAVIQKHSPGLPSKPQPPAANVVPINPRSTAAFVGEKEPTPAPPETQEEIDKLWSVLNHKGPDGKRVFDPDCPERRWKDVLMSLASLGWACAVDIADKWSKQATTPGLYPERDEVEKQVLRFAQAGRAGRTERALYREAIDAGWTEPVAQQPVISTPTFVNSPLAGGLKVINIGMLLKNPAPPQPWVVPKWLPDETLTLLAGDGGSGKSMLMLQLCMARAAGATWMGFPLAQGNALYLSAEDPEDDIHRRTERIAAQMNLQLGALDGFNVIDFTVEDETELVSPARVGRETKLQVTGVLEKIERLAVEYKAGLVVFDANSDFYGGDEINRREVKLFTKLLRRRAEKLKIAIVLIAHPSVEGMNSGRGYSGSTQWNNGPRARWKFGKLPKDNGTEPDPDVRVLELAKANKGRDGEKIELRWVDGVLVLAAAIGSQTSQSVKEANARMDEAKQVFLELLDAFTEQGRKVNCGGGKTYAPKMMFEHVPHPTGSNNRRFTQKELTSAMNLLFNEQAIRNETEGSPSKQRSYLVRRYGNCAFQPPSNPPFQP